MTTLTVEFGEHLPEAKTAGMLGALQAAGEVRAEGPRQYSVAVRRSARAGYLRKQFTEWERHGFLTWTEQA
jgi:hypothetical protein